MLLEFRESPRRWMLPNGLSTGSRSFILFSTYNFVNCPFIDPSTSYLESFEISRWVSRSECYRISCLSYQEIIIFLFSFLLFLFLFFRVLAQVSFLLLFFFYSTKKELIVRYALLPVNLLNFLFIYVLFPPSPPIPSSIFSEAHLFSFVFIFCDFCEGSFLF